VTDQKMMVATRTISFGFTFRDKIPMVKFQVRSAKRNAVMPREAMVDLNYHPVLFVFSAPSTIGFHLSMFFLDMMPLRASKMSGFAFENIMEKFQMSLHIKLLFLHAAKGGHLVTLLPLRKIPRQGFNIYVKFGGNRHEHDV
jgi:hypothetical protein